MCESPVCKAGWIRPKTRVTGSESKIEEICSEIKRLAADAADRDDTCDCDGSDPGYYHTEKCAGRREMQRRKTARKTRDEYLCAAAPILVKHIESLERSSISMRALVEDMVITMRHVPKDALFDALQQWHRKASTALAREDAERGTTTEKSA